jgi:hypothetical protein
MKRFVFKWAIAGLLVPVIILLIARLQGGVFRWPYLAVILWPSWIMAGAIDASENPPLSFIIFVLGISIGLNVVLYSVLGVLVWWFMRFWKKQE